MALQLEKQILMDMTMQGIQSLSSFNTPEAENSRQQLSSIYNELLSLDASKIDFISSAARIKKLCSYTPEMLKTKVIQKYQDYLESMGKQKPLDTSFEIPDFDDFEL